MKKNKSNTKKKKRIWIPFAAVFGPFLLMVLYSFNTETDSTMTAERIIIRDANL